MPKILRFSSLVSKRIFKGKTDPSALCHQRSRKGSVYVEKWRIYAVGCLIKNHRFLWSAMFLSWFLCVDMSNSILTSEMV